MYYFLHFSLTLLSLLEHQFYPVTWNVYPCVSTCLQRIPTCKGVVCLLGCGLGLHKIWNTKWSQNILFVLQLSYIGDCYLEPESHRNDKEMQSVYCKNTHFYHLKYTTTIIESCITSPLKFLILISHFSYNYLSFLKQFLNRSPSTPPQLQLCHSEQLSVMTSHSFFIA